MNTDRLHIDKQEVLLHVLFWLGWITSFTVIQTLGTGGESWLVWLMYYLITLPVFVIHTYLIAYWLLPQTFFKGKYLLFLLGAIVFLLVFSVIELVISHKLVFEVFDHNLVLEPEYLNFKNVLISGIGNHYIILVFLAIKAGASWYRAENRKEELLRSKVERELEIYRYQLQPKMVYTLVEELEIQSKKDPEKAPEMIIKISDFLNVFLFEGKEELIPLSLEVRLMEQFLAIHTSAIGDRLQSNFVVNGNLKPYIIPPLLILPFINSAIKLVYECNKTFEITVLIKAERKYLLFSFSFWSQDEFSLKDDENSRITRKRLRYAFPGKHRLVENIDDNFKEISIEIYN